MLRTFGEIMPCGVTTEGRTCEVSVMSTCDTPGSALTARSASSFIRWRTGQAGVVSSILNDTTLPAMATSLMKPSDTRSLRRSGSWTDLRALSTCSLVTDIGTTPSWQEDRKATTRNLATSHLQHVIHIFSSEV